MKLEEKKRFSRASAGQCISEGISIIIPCYREAFKVVEMTANRIRGALDEVVGLNYEIILVNDGTEEAIDYEKLEDSIGLICVNHKVNRGYGASLATGLSEANYPWIGIIDSDGTYPCEAFVEMVKEAGSYEMVIGARSWSEISFVRRPAKMALTLFASYLANHRIPDLNSGMRVFHRRIYDENWRIYPERFSFSSTLTMAALTHLKDVKFVSITYSRRIGKSFISPVRDTVRFLYQLLRLSLYFRPLRIFLPLSALLSFMAVARGLRDYSINQSLGGLTLIFFFMAFQVFFFGLIAEIINKK